MTTPERQTENCADSDALARALLGDASDMALFASLDGRLEFANAAAMRSLELSQDRLPTDLSDLVHESDRAAWETWMSRAQRCIDGARIELALRTSHGARVSTEGTIRSDQHCAKCKRVRLVLRELRSDTESLRLLERSNDVFRSVAEAQAAYLEQGDCRAAIARLLHYALQQTQSEYGFFGVLVAGRLRVLAHDGIVWDDVVGREFYNAAAALYAKQGYLEFTNMQTLFGTAIRNNEVVLTNAAPLDPRRGGLPPGHPPLRNFLGVPVTKGGKVTGLIGLGNHPMGFTEDDVARIRAILQTATLLFDVYLHELEENELREKRRHAEQDMRTAQATLDATDDAALVFDPTTLKFLFVNDGAVRQLGYTREELLRLTPLDIAPRLDEPTLRARLAEIQRSGGRSTNPLTTHRRKDGTEFPVEVNVRFLAPENEPARFIAIARDITERRQSERVAQRSQRLEAIGTLAGGVAHDLNNALTPIMMAIESLRETAPDEGKLLDVLESSARRASSMVRSLLTFAKGAEGKHLPLHAAQLLEEIEKIARSTFPKNIRVETEIAPSLPPVRGDATQLHQVLLNLAVNARDAMPAGGVLRLEAQHAHLDENAAKAIPDGRAGHFVVLRVVDTGTGIPPNILDRIFDPFFTTKGPDQGTGLGLSIAVGIVKGHRGFLHAQSTTGRGSSFCAYLPAAPFRSEEGVGGESRAEAKRTLLFVDDEPAIRTLAELVFPRLGISVVACAGGRDALARLAQLGDRVAGVVTDLHMPDMDGLSLIRSLRSASPDLRIALISGRLEEDVVEQLRALGVVHQLRKPFSQGEVAAFLSRFLG